MTAKEISIKYCDDVLSGSVIAGNTIKLACQRFLNDLNREDLEFREYKVDTLLKFTSVLKHYTSDFSGKSVKLEPWQVFIVSNIFGWYWVESGKRRYTQSYIEVSRKQGKTFLSAIMCLFALIADGEDGAEVDLAANSRKQSGIAFDMCGTLAKQLDPRQKNLRVYRNEIKFFPTNSKLNVFAADDSKLDGFNCSFGLLDEYHAAANSKVRDVIKSSQGMRKNPHLCTITTAGFNKEYPCYQFRSYCLEVLHNIKTDDSLFATIYCLDEDDDWTDEDVWIKSNPNLGVTVTKSYISEQVNQALNNPSDEVGVLTKTLNCWCDAELTWISQQKIMEQTTEVDLNKFNPDEWVCFAGFDLASVSDLTALSFLLTNGDEYYVKNFYFIPEYALKDKFMSSLYKEWFRKGYLNVTPGDVTDYDYVYNILREWYEKLSVRKVGYDAWNATQFCIKCVEGGMNLREYSQSLGSFNKPTRELERLILSGKLFIDNNPINQHCFANVMLKSDWNGNVKPTKDMSSGKKIDGVIALLEALGLYLQEPHFTNEVFTF